MGWGWGGMEWAGGSRQTVRLGVERRDVMRATERGGNAPAASADVKASLDPCIECAAPTLRTRAMEALYNIAYDVSEA